MLWERIVSRRIGFWFVAILSLLMGFGEIVYKR